VSIFDRLFGKKPKITKIYKLPEDERLGEAVDKLINKKLADVLAENYQLKQEINKLRAMVESKSDEEFKQLKEKAKEMYKVQKQIDKKKRVIFRIYSDDRNFQLPMFFLKSNKTYDPYKYFWGVELYETDDGYVIWYPLLTDGKKVVRFKKPATRFDDFFKEKIGIVRQLNSGKLDSNFDVDEYGNPVLLLDNEGYDAESNTRIKIVNLSDQERQKYEMKIAQLKDMINQLYTELEEAKKREVEYKQELADKEMALNVTKHENDIASANLVAMAEKQMSLFKQLTDALLSIQDIKLSQILTEDMVNRLRETVEITRDKLDEVERQTPEDFKDKLKDMYSTFMAKLNKLSDKIDAITGGGGG